MPHRANGKKYRGFWSSLGYLLSKVPAEVAGPVIIIIIVTYELVNIIPYLKNEIHIAMVLSVLLMFGFGGTYCIILFARSKARERQFKYAWRGLENFRKRSEETTNKVSEEVEKAVSSMRGVDNDQ